MVVFPALSSPSTRIFSSSFLFLRRFRRMLMRPPPWVVINLNNYKLSLIEIVIDFNWSDAQNNNIRVEPFVFWEDFSGSEF